MDFKIQRIYSVTRFIDLNYLQIKTQPCEMQLNHELIEHYCIASRHEYKFDIIITTINDILGAALYFAIELIKSAIMLLIFYFLEQTCGEIVNSNSEMQLHRVMIIFLKKNYCISFKHKIKSFHCPANNTSLFVTQFLFIFQHLEKVFHLLQ